ncbi:MAG: aspartate phosphatase [Pseudomonadota bacterium]
MSREVRQPIKRPVLTQGLRGWLGVVFLLFALLAVNSIYLAGVTIAESVTGAVYQDYYYLIMFVVHLALGLVLVPGFLVFAIGHMRRAWHRPNRNAVRAGLGLFITGLVLLVSGILLTRFDFLTINDQAARTVLYWAHVATPLVAAWLFVLHRLAGPRIRWALARRWALVAAGFAGLMVAVHLMTAAPATESREGTFGPSLAVYDGEPDKVAEHLMIDDFCAECHGDIEGQLASSVHRLSSFNNPVYRFSIDDTRRVLMERDGNVKVARLCASCHDQVPLFSGDFDDPHYDADSDPGASAGITCVGCHSIKQVNSPLGNGAYTLEDPPRYPFAFSDNGFLKVLNRQLIKAKPAFHKQSFLKPVHKTAEFCSVCHKVGLPYELNHYKWLRGQDHYGSFLLSGVSGHRVDSFYYPDHAAANCAACHMPLVASDDPAARHFGDSDERSVHNHLFAAANNAVPLLMGLEETGNAERQRMMQQAARVDIFGIKRGGVIEGELMAPLRPEVPALEPGKRYLLETVVRTIKIGHKLTQGTVDSNELWLDVTLTSGGKVVGRSGELGEDGDVDPWAYFLNAYILTQDGKRIDRRNAQDVFVALYDHQIPPGAAAVVHYAFDVPEGISGPLEVEVKLRYRKFDTRLMRHVEGGELVRNDLPITTLAQDSIVFPVSRDADAGVKISAEIPDQASRIPLWQRWNDYGIGLLREGNSGSNKGELRQAAHAFGEVESLGRAEGPLNLARVYFKEGRLEDTATALQRAQKAGAYPWTLGWYAARVDREYGRLDRAIEQLEAIVDTRFTEARERGFDFSKDIRVLNLLGRTLFEKSRATRGRANQPQREALLNASRQRFEEVLVIDPEDVDAHYNLALVAAQLGDTPASERHRTAHDKYRHDDLAVATAVTRHRAENAAANHAAAPIVIYDLQRPEAYGLQL